MQIIKPGLVYAVRFSLSALASGLPPDEKAERNCHPAYATLATGELSNRSTPAVATQWPVKVHSIGPTVACYQNYGVGEPYFHAGLDILAQAGSDVVAAVGGKVLSVNQSMPRVQHTGK